VVLTQPDDAAKLDALVAKSDTPLVSREIDGWTAVSDDNTTLDDFELLRSVGTLDGVDAYRKVSGEVGVDGLAQIYVAPSALASRGRSFFKPLLGPDAPALAVSLRPEEDGLHVQGAISPALSDLFSDEFQAELQSRVPGDVLLYAGTSDLERQLGALRDMLAVAAPELDRDIARVEAQIGVSLDEDVFPLFSGESALYVRPGFPIPEVTLVTQVDDGQGALAGVDKLARQVVGHHGAARLRAVETGGVQAKELAVDKLFSVYYAAFDGRLVITTSAQGIADLRSDAARVANDSAFESATEAAGMPGETTGFIYVDLDKAVPSALALAGLGGGEIPTWLQQDLEPLHSLVLYGTREGNVARFQGLLAIH
jgi:hypothetical protein